MTEEDLSFFLVFFGNIAIAGFVFVSVFCHWDYLFLCKSSNKSGDCSGLVEPVNKMTYCLHLRIFQCTQEEFT